MSGPSRVAARRWQMLELSFEAASLPDEPAGEPALHVAFHGPGDEVYRVAAFWDGGRTWRVRFTPTAQGLWSYRTEPAAGTGLQRTDGQLQVAPPRGSNPLRRHGGFLAVSPNRRYLTYTDGTPFFWLGDTWWFCPSPLVPYEGSSRPGVASMYRALIDTRKAQGFTIAHMAFLGADGGESGGTGIFAGDVNTAYWRGVDLYLEYANRAGIIPVIGLGFHQGLNQPSLEELQRLWRYVLARYGAFAVTFLICGEYNMAGGADPTGQTTFTATDAARVEKLLRLGQFIKDHDAYRRAMTIHPWWYGGEQQQAWDLPWYDFIMLQGGHEREGPAPEVYRSIYQRAHPKPLLEGECTYEGIFGYSDEVVRHNAYKAIGSGSFGYTYGSHGLWYPNQDESDTRFGEWGTPVPWWVALARPGAAEMGHLRRLYEAAEWWALEPLAEDEAITRTHGAPSSWQTITVKAAGRRLMVLYVPSGQHPQEALALTHGQEGAAYSVTVINPRTGRTSGGTRRATFERGTMALPLPRGGQDWVVVVRRSEE